MHSSHSREGLDQFDADWPITAAEYEAAVARAHVERSRHISRLLKSLFSRKVRQNDDIETRDMIGSRA